MPGFGLLDQSAVLHAFFYLECSKKHAKCRIQITKTGYVLTITSKKLQLRRKVWKQTLVYRRYTREEFNMTLKFSFVASWAKSASKTLLEMLHM